MTIHVSDIEWRRLARYLAGESDNAESAEVERWMGADPDRSAAVDQLRQAIALRGAGIELANVDHARERFEERLQEYLRDAAQTERVSSRLPQKAALSSVRSWSGARILRIVMQSTIAVGIAMLVMGILRTKTSTVDGTTRTYVTQTGQEATFTLSDGTEVRLAPRTTLRLIQFSTTMRTVTLDGQAYFNVVHHGAVPFVVRSGDVTTRVLGTAFAVRHYASETHTRIAVASGKVVVSANAPLRSDVTLTTGHIGDVTDSIVKVMTVDDLSSDTGWLHDRLVFNDAPIPEVLEALRRWYGYEFQLNDPNLAHRNVTVVLSTHSSAEALLVLKKLLNVRLTMTGDTVTLTPLRARHGGGVSKEQIYDVWTPNREVGR